MSPERLRRAAFQLLRSETHAIFKNNKCVINCTIADQTLVLAMPSTVRDNLSKSEGDRSAVTYLLQVH